MTAQIKTALARAAGTARTQYNAFIGFVERHSALIFETLLLVVAMFDGFMIGRVL